MIHFDFTVSEADAENIFSIIRNQILLNNQKIIDLIGKPGQEHYIEAYRRDNEYVEKLIGQMINARIVK